MNRKPTNIQIPSVYKYSILDDLSLIIEYYQGDFTLESVKELTSKIINDPKFNSNCVFIIDLRLTYIKMSKEDLYNCGVWVSKNLKLTGLARLAILTSNPEQVVASMIYTLNDHFTNHHYEVFSSIEATTSWLNINSNHNTFIHGLINNMYTPPKHEY
ncbi:hypothetical protein FHR24_001560 [Wenyingzhuangia heitensis]|uniref:SpoIIAA-like n=1 Tax=Wenyingzhuangia heitensis TaxID=1487859 RepID=A0ABX0UD87_9FLAO|nr:hypothetical protein [Wenyingzhuangia heitensis]NIJ45121.1 hypothetical protein [Wenyingzhuangia heitensis]